MNRQARLRVLRATLDHVCRRWDARLPQERQSPEWREQVRREIGQMRRICQSLLHDRPGAMN